MALAHFHFWSPTLSKQVAMEALIPDRGSGPFPVIYLLHGLSDDHTIWLRRTRLEMYVSEAPLIIVMPDGFRGFYTDNNQGPAYGKYIADDVVAFTDRVLPTVRSRAGRGIGGLSMGGYGALRLALAHPEKFASAHSHSGALLHGTKRWDKEHDRPNIDELQRVYGPRPAGTAHDILHLAAKLPRKKLPKLRLDCGTEDFLLNDNREFHARLDELKIPHEYHESPGSHHWDYWDRHIQDALAWHASFLLG
jgi:S-formylglutathione hydrolase FrmB